MLLSKFTTSKCNLVQTILCCGTRTQSHISHQRMQRGRMELSQASILEGEMVNVQYVSSVHLNTDPFLSIHRLSRNKVLGHQCVLLPTSYKHTYHTQMRVIIIMYIKPHLLKENAGLHVVQVTRCAEDVSSNTRSPQLHSQLCWGDGRCGSLIVHVCFLVNLAFIMTVLRFINHCLLVA